MAQPSFAPPIDKPAEGPLMEVPADPPFDFVGKPDFAGPPEGVGKPEDVGRPNFAGPPEGVGGPDDHLPPVDHSGLPPIHPPFEDTPVEPPLFDTPPVGLPDLDIG